MASTQKLTSLPVIQATGMDYASVISEIQDIIQNNKNWKENWSQFYASEAGTMLVQLMAWICDNLAIKQDLLYNENYLSTATSDKSKIRLLNQIGYFRDSVKASRVNISISLKKPVGEKIKLSNNNGGNINNVLDSILKFNSQDINGSNCVWEILDLDEEDNIDYLQPVELSATKVEFTESLSNHTLKAIQGETRYMEFSSDNVDSPSFILNESNIDTDSICIYGINANKYTKHLKVKSFYELGNLNLNYGGVEDTLPCYTLRRNEDNSLVISYPSKKLADNNSIIKGHSYKAGTTIGVFYRTAKGTDCNIALNSMNTDIKLTYSDENKTVDAVVRNTSVGYGGREEETLKEAVEEGPTQLHRNSRAVTISDFDDVLRENSLILSSKTYAPNNEPSGFYKYYGRHIKPQEVFSVLIANKNFKDIDFTKINYFPWFDTVKESVVNQYYNFYDVGLNKDYEAVTSANGVMVSIKDGREDTNTKGKYELYRNATLYKTSKDLSGTVLSELTKLENDIPTYMTVKVHTSDKNIQYIKDINFALFDGKYGDSSLKTDNNIISDDTYSATITAPYFSKDVINIFNYEGFKLCLDDSIEIKIDFQKYIEKDLEYIGGNKKGCYAYYVYLNNPEKQNYPTVLTESEKKDLFNSEKGAEHRKGLLQILQEEIDGFINANDGWKMTSADNLGEPIKTFNIKDSDDVVKTIKYYKDANGCYYKEVDGIFYSYSSDGADSDSTEQAINKATLSNQIVYADLGLQFPKSTLSSAIGFEDCNEENTPIFANDNYYGIKINGKIYFFKINTTNIKNAKQYYAYYSNNGSKPISAYPFIGGYYKDWWNNTNNEELIKNKEELNKSFKEKLKEFINTIDQKDGYLTSYCNDETTKKSLFGEKVFDGKEHTKANVNEITQLEIDNFISSFDDSKGKFKDIILDSFAEEWEKLYNATSPYTQGKDYDSSINKTGTYSSFEDQVAIYEAENRDNPREEAFDFYVKTFKDLVCRNTIDNIIDNIAEKISGVVDKGDYIKFIKDKLYTTGKVLDKNSALQGVEIPDENCGLTIDRLATVLDYIFTPFKADSEDKVYLYDNGRITPVNGIDNLKVSMVKKEHFNYNSCSSKFTFDKYDDNKEYDLRFELINYTANEDSDEVLTISSIVDDFKTDDEITLGDETITINKSMDLISLLFGRKDEVKSSRISKDKLNEIIQYTTLSDGFGHFVLTSPRKGIGSSIYAIESGSKSFLNQFFGCKMTENNNETFSTDKAFGVRQLEMFVSRTGDFGEMYYDKSDKPSGSVDLGDLLFTDNDLNFFNTQRVIKLSYKLGEKFEIPINEERQNFAYFNDTNYEKYCEEKGLRSSVGIDGGLIYKNNGINKYNIPLSNFCIKLTKDQVDPSKTVYMINEDILETMNVVKSTKVDIPTMKFNLNGLYDTSDDTGESINFNNMPFIFSVDNVDYDDNEIYNPFMQSKAILTNLKNLTPIIMYKMIIEEMAKSKNYFESEHYDLNLYALKNQICHLQKNEDRIVFSSISNTSNGNNSFGIKFYFPSDDDIALYYGDVDLDSLSCLICDFYKALFGTNLTNPELYDLYPKECMDKDIIHSISEDEYYYSPCVNSEGIKCNLAFRPRCYDKENYLGVKESRPADFYIKCEEGTDKNGELKYNFSIVREQFAIFPDDGFYLHYVQDRSLNEEKNLDETIINNYIQKYTIGGLDFHILKPSFRTFDICGTIYINRNNSFDDVKKEVISQIENKYLLKNIDNLNIGNRIYYSDIVSIISKVNGVARFDITYFGFDQLKKQDYPTTTSYLEVEDDQDFITTIVLAETDKSHGLQIQFEKENS